MRTLGGHHSIQYGASFGVHRLGQVQSQAGVFGTRSCVPQADGGHWAAKAYGELWQRKLEFGAGQALAGMGTVIS